MASDSEAANKAEPGDGSAYFGNTAIGNMFEIFIAPEVRRRGLTIDPRSIDLYLVELRPDGVVDVRLGDEAHLSAELVKAQGGGFYLENVVPQDGEVGPNSGWVAFIRAENGAGTLGFDFRRNLGHARALVTKAERFLSSAVDSGEENLSPSIDALHSAAELTVQALMLLQSNDDTSHERRRKWLKRWTKAQNSPANHSDVLDNLAAQRDRARYEPGDPRLKPGRFKVLVSAIQEMIDTAHMYVGDRSPGVRVQIADQFVRHETWSSAAAQSPQ